MTTTGDTLILWATKFMYNLLMEGDDMASKLDQPGLARVSSMEKNQHKQGRSGGETLKLGGPVRSVKHNATQGGGINRSTRGSGSGKHEN